MSDLETLLAQVHDAENDLADELRTRGQRHAPDHDVWYMCQTLVKQTEARASAVRDAAADRGVSISAPSSDGTLSSVAASVREKAADLVGRRPETGLLLIEDLTALFIATQRVNVEWLMLGQVAQALRDEDLLSMSTPKHKQVLTQIK